MSCSDDQERHALSPQGEDLVDERFHQGRIDAGSRFVKQDQFWLVHQYSRQFQQLLLTT